MKIGVDIIDVRRIAKMIKNKRFLERVYTAEEVRYCMRKVNRAQHFAVKYVGDIQKSGLFQTDINKRG